MTEDEKRGALRGLLLTIAASVVAVVGLTTGLGLLWEATGEPGWLEHGLRLTWLVILTALLLITVVEYRQRRRVRMKMRVIEHLAVSLGLTRAPGEDAMAFLDRVIVALARHVPEDDPDYFDPRG
jgi:hypothetical protein